MSGKVVKNAIARLDADLGELHNRAEACRELLHRCVLDLVSMEYRADCLLDRRNRLVAIDAAAAASMDPARAQKKR